MSDINDISIYINAHHHVNNGVDDSCLKCFRDLRDPIHLRSGETTEQRLKQLGELATKLRADKRELVEGLERLRGEMKKPFDLVDWDGCYLIVHALITKHGEP